MCTLSCGMMYACKVHRGPWYCTAITRRSSSCSVYNLTAAIPPQPQGLLCLVDALRNLQQEHVHNGAGPCKAKPLSSDVNTMQETSTISGDFEQGFLVHFIFLLSHAHIIPVSPWVLVVLCCYHHKTSHNAAPPTRCLASPPTPAPGHLASNDMQSVHIVFLQGC